MSCCCYSGTLPRRRLQVLHPNGLSPSFCNFTLPCPITCRRVCVSPLPGRRTYDSRHTLGAVYLGGGRQGYKGHPAFEEVDHLARRKERDIKEIAEVCAGCFVASLWWGWWREEGEWTGGSLHRLHARSRPDPERPEPCDHRARRASG